MAIRNLIRKNGFVGRKKKSLCIAQAKFNTCIFEASIYNSELFHCSQNFLSYPSVTCFFPPFVFFSLIFTDIMCFVIQASGSIHVFNRWDFVEKNCKRRIGTQKCFKKIVPSETLFSPRSKIIHS